MKQRIKFWLVFVGVLALVIGGLVAMHSAPALVGTVLALSVLVWFAWHYANCVKDL